MNRENLAQFADQQYLNLESYRKNGDPVRTPLWFAEERGLLYIYSLAGAGKVKRVRRNPQVRVVPCGSRGSPKGHWAEGKARIVDSVTAERGHRLLVQKYGWMKRIGDFYSHLRKRERVVIEIQLA